MTYQIWTRIVVAGLILLGDSAVASEISQRSDTEAVVSGSTVQISQPESLDDSDSIWLPLLMGAGSIQDKVTHRYLTSTTLAKANTNSSEYSLYNSRAPPASF